MLKFMYKVLSIIFLINVGGDAYVSRCTLSESDSDFNYKK